MQNPKPHNPKPQTPNPKPQFNVCRREPFSKLEIRAQVPFVFNRQPLYSHQQL